MCARKYTGKKKVYWGLIWALDWGCQDRTDRIKKSSNILSSQYEHWSWWSFVSKRRHSDRQRIVYQLYKTRAGKTTQIRKWCLDVFQHPLLLIWLGGLLFWIPNSDRQRTLYFILYKTRAGRIAQIRNDVLMASNILSIWLGGLLCWKEDIPKNKWLTDCRVRLWFGKRYRINLPSF